MEAALKQEGAAKKRSVEEGERELARLLRLQGTRMPPRGVKASDADEGAAAGEEKGVVRGLGGMGSLHPGMGLAPSGMWGPAPAALQQVSGVAGGTGGEGFGGAGRGWLL